MFQVASLVRSYLASNTVFTKQDDWISYYNVHLFLYFCILLVISLASFFALKRPRIVTNGTITRALFLVHLFAISITIYFGYSSIPTILESTRVSKGILDNLMLLDNGNFHSSMLSEIDSFQSSTLNSIQKLSSVSESSSTIYETASNFQNEFNLFVINSLILEINLDKFTTVINTINQNIQNISVLVNSINTVSKTSLTLVNILPQELDNSEMLYLISKIMDLNKTISSDFTLYKQTHLKNIQFTRNINTIFSDTINECIRFLYSNKKQEIRNRNVNLLSNTIKNIATYISSIISIQVIIISMTIIVRLIFFYNQFKPSKWIKISTIFTIIALVFVFFELMSAQYLQDICKSTSYPTRKRSFEGVPYILDLINIYDFCENGTVINNAMVSVWNEPVYNVSSISAGLIGFVGSLGIEYTVSNTPGFIVDDLTLIEIQNVDFTQIAKFIETVEIYREYPLDSSNFTDTIQNPLFYIQQFNEIFECIDRLKQNKQTDLQIQSNKISIESKEFNNKIKLLSNIARSYIDSKTSIELGFVELVDQVKIDVLDSIEYFESRVGYLTNEYKSLPDCLDVNNGVEGLYENVCTNVLNAFDDSWFSIFIGLFVGWILIILLGGIEIRNCLDEYTDIEMAGDFKSSTGVGSTRQIEEEEKESSNDGSQDYESSEHDYESEHQVSKISHVENYGLFSIQNQVKDRQIETSQHKIQWKGVNL